MGFVLNIGRINYIMFYIFFIYEKINFAGGVVFIILIFFKIRYKVDLRLVFEVCFGVGCVVGIVFV